MYLVWVALFHVQRTPFLTRPQTICFLIYDNGQEKWGNLSIKLKKCIIFFVFCNINTLGCWLITHIHHFLLQKGKKWGQTAPAVWRFLAGRILWSTGTQSQSCQFLALCCLLPIMCSFHSPWNPWHIRGVLWTSRACWFFQFHLLSAWEKKDISDFSFPNQTLTRTMFLKEIYAGSSQISHLIAQREYDEEFNTLSQSQFQKE